MSEHLEPNREYVVGFMFDTSGEAVLLIQKNRPTWQAGKLNGIGGRIEDGETPDDAMRREFLEETGVDYAAWQRFCTLRDERGWLVHFYLGSGDLLKAKSQTDEKVLCCGLRALHQTQALPNLHWLIPMALSLKHERINRWEIQERS
jgi:8-oxo-dGTP diphosphatase